MTASAISPLEPARKSRDCETLSMLAEHGPFGAAMRVLPPGTAIEVAGELSAPPRDGRPGSASIRAGCPPAAVADLFDRNISKKDRRAALAAFKEKHLDGALGAELSQAAFKEMMEIEIEGEIDARKEKPGRDPEETWRNGYRKTTRKTASGEVAIDIPKLRKGTYYPGFLERWNRHERKLAALFQEAWIGGISTRGMDRIARILVPCGISRSAVSRVCKRIDERVKELTESSLEGVWRIVYIDATYVKSHVEGRVRDRAVAAAIGIDEKGGRHVLGVSVMASESGENWRGFLGSLIERGLRGVKLVVADGGRGLRSAVGALLPGADFQLCGVHWMRSVLRHVPSKWKDAAGDLLKWIFEGGTREEIRDRMDAALALLASMFPNVDFSAHAGDAIFDDLTTFARYPKNLWKRLWTTNLVERQNREIKRRTKAISIFPNDESIMRLIGARLLATDEAWRAEGEYMSESDLAAVALVASGKGWAARAASGMPDVSCRSECASDRRAA